EGPAGLGEARTCSDPDFSGHGQRATCERDAAAEFDACLPTRRSSDLNPRARGRGKAAATAPFSPAPTQTQRPRGRFHGAVVVEGNGDSESFAAFAAERGAFGVVDERFGPVVQERFGFAFGVEGAGVLD